MLTKVSCACGKFSATSRNSGASWVQATVTGAPSASAALNRSSSRPQSWLACVILPAQPRPIACASSGMVFSQLQIRRWGDAALMVNDPEPAGRSRGCFGLWSAVAANAKSRKVRGACRHGLERDSIHRANCQALRMRSSMSRACGSWNRHSICPRVILWSRCAKLGDAFAHGCDIAAEVGRRARWSGCGATIWSNSPWCSSPTSRCESARRAFFAGMNAVADAIAAHCPPEREVSFDWPDAIRFDGGLLGGARLGWPQDCAEDDVPAWLVFGVILRAADMAHVEEVQAAAGVSLLSEGFRDDRHRRDHRKLRPPSDDRVRPLERARLRGDRRRLSGTASQAQGGRAPSHRQQRRSPGQRCRRGSGPPERTSLVDALARAAWYDPHARGPKLG